MTEPKQRREMILHRPEQALAEEFGTTIEEVQAILDAHPVETDRDSYLRRALAQQLLLLDRLEVTFGRMAFEDRDTAAGALLVKVAERKATLLGLNAPIGHAVRVVSHPPEHRQSSTDRIEAALNALSAQPADQDIGVFSAAVGEMDGNATAILLDALERMPKMIALAINGLKEDLP
jgi:hypothetical protein